MNNIHDSGNKGTTLTGRVRMAYSFQGYQPVLCTILCDQPLYYMEEEIFEEEDNSLFLEEEQSINAALGMEMGTIHKKIGIYDSMARKFGQAPDARLGVFAENAASLGAHRTDGATFTDALIALLGQSRYAQSLMDAAREKGVAIRASHQVRHAAYDAAAKAILVNPEQASGDALLSAIGALRLCVRDGAGAQHHPLSFHPDEAVLVNRMQAADRAAAMVRGAWELQLAGIGDAWSRIENSQACDLGRAFAREALTDFRTLNNGRAMQAAFENWFLSDRCKIEDRELIQAMLTDQDARQFETATQALNPAYIAATGEQTLGKNYLAELTGTILSDPIFSDVRDRSNANFLWFVKFERSFNKAEQELQGQTIHSPETLQDTLQSREENKNNDVRTIIYDWANPDKAQSGAPMRASAAANGSNVVYVSFGKNF